MGKLYKKETLIENDVVQIDIDSEGIVDIKPKTPEGVELTERDLLSLAKVSKVIKADK